ncbi:MAG: DUF72 domain-containing protein [Vicinamibacterales bacterium]|nr:DUF72 domain-containing protein [Vicinamibacterales bacterium]
MSNLRIGTSGWNYPSGKGAWTGVFYPPKRGRAKGFDELAYYAEHFDTVEINTTFYGQPKAGVAQTWVERTPRDFEFSLKLYRKLTHADAPGVLRLDDQEIDAYRLGIEPLANAGKIGALLAQFPPSFKQSPQSHAYLDALLLRFRDYPIAVELRHRSWSDAFDQTMSLLNAHGAALTQIDEPKFKLSIRQNQLPNVTSFYYMRLHGRNAAQWWKHDKAEDRYNYLYSADELAPIAETATAARQLVKKFYLYFNNHHSAKGVVNAVMIKHRLGEPVPGRYPRSFIDAYPHIANVVTPDYTEAWTPVPLLHSDQ